MMYSEFIEISNFTEQYISFAEYTTCIEPIYMAADQIPTKQEFISLLRDAFKILVNPVVEKLFTICHWQTSLLIWNADHSKFRTIWQRLTSKLGSLHISTCDSP